MCVFSVSSALSLSLSKVFPLTLPKKNIPKNINFFAPKGNSFALKKGAKSEKKKRRRFAPAPRLRARCSFLKSFPAREGQKHFRAYQKGARKRRERESFMCPRFSFLPVVFRPRARKFTDKRLYTFFCRSYAALFSAFFLREAKKKTIARILLKLPHANDKNALRLSIRTGEWILRVV